MAVILRSTKGTPLTNDEVDNNFLSLLPLVGGVMTGPVTLPAQDIAGVDNIAATQRFVKDQNYQKKSDLFASETRDFAQDVANTSGLRYAYFGSRVRNANVVNSVPSGAITLAPSTTHYIEVDATGAVFASTGGFTIGKYPTAIVTTNGSTITSVQDQRSFVSIPQPLPIASNTVLGGVLAGAGVSIDENGFLSVPPGNYTLPVATPQELGGVKQGSGVVIAPDGTISAESAVYTLPQASATVLGGIKLSSNFTVNQEGLTEVVFPDAYSLPIATDTVLGGVIVGTGINRTVGGVISVTPGNYTLPAASGSVLGGVKIGSGIDVVADGTISVPPGGYTLPQASGTVLGGIKLGSGLTLNGTTGQVDASGASSYTLPQASGTVLGGIKLGENLTFNATTGQVDAPAPAGYTLPQASSTTLGGLRLGNNLSFNQTTQRVDAVAANYTLPVASGSVLGGVKQGSNVQIAADGTLSVTTSASTSLGNVTFGNITLPYTPNKVRDSAESKVDWTWISPKPMSGVVRSVTEETVFTSINLNNYIPMDGHTASSANNALLRSIPDKVNEVMAAASLLGRAARSDKHSWGFSAGAYVRVEHHVGDIVCRRQLVVPHHVMFHSQGMIFRDPYGSSTTSDWPSPLNDSNTTARSDKNSYIPLMALTVHGHIDCATLVGHNGSTRGTIIATGKEFEGLTWEVVNGGSGYAVNQELVLVKHGQTSGFAESFQAEPLNKTVLRVVSVDAAGKILEVTSKFPTLINNDPNNVRTYGGDYFTTVNDAFEEIHEAITGPSNTATFKVTSYRNDFQDNVQYKRMRDGLTWSEGRYHVWFNRSPFAQQIINHLNLIEPGDDLIESQWGWHYGFMCNTKNIEINRLYCIGGRFSIYFAQGSDARINNMNTVLAGTALRVNGYTSWSCPNAIFDSSWWSGVEFNGCSGTQFNGRVFWENGNDDEVGKRRGHSPHASGYAIKIGHTGSVNQISSAVDFRCQVTNAGNLAGTGIICQLDRLSMSRIEVICANSEYDGRPNADTKHAKALFEFGVNGVLTLERDAAGNQTTTPIMKSDNKIIGQISHLKAGQEAILGNPLSNWLEIWDGTAGRNTFIKCREVCEIFGDGTPINGTSGTGAGRAAGGSQYFKTDSTSTNNGVWVNVGTKTTPNWVKTTP